MTDVIKEPGVYRMDKATYNLDPVCEPSLRASVAWKLIAPGSTPAHAYHDLPRVNPDWKAPEYKKHFALGSACHEFILGRGAGYKVVKAADWKTKSARMARETIMHGGQTALLEHEEREVLDMVTSAKRQMRDLVDYGSLPTMPFEHHETEKVIVWQETVGAHRIWCRAELDGMDIEEGAINELKTEGESAHPEIFKWRMRKFGYALKLAHYRRGLEKIGLCHSPTVRIFAIETKPPYLMAMHLISDEFIEQETHRLMEAYKIYAVCLARNQWRGYSLDGYEQGLLDRERIQEAQQSPANQHLSSEDIAAGI